MCLMIAIIAIVLIAIYFMWSQRRWRHPIFNEGILDFDGDADDEGIEYDPLEHHNQGDDAYMEEVNRLRTDFPRPRLPRRPQGS